MMRKGKNRDGRGGDGSSRLGRIGEPVVLVDVEGFPGVVDPDVADGLGGLVAFVHHVGRQVALLGLVLVLWGGDGGPGSERRRAGKQAGGGMKRRTCKTKMLNWVSGPSAPIF